MLELENFGVVEMSSQEQLEIEGGILPFILAAILLGGYIYASYNGGLPPP